ncbi:M-phase inducer phosphatase-like [Argopecten irradians]|uniref:M-phase inducer phosphatase-like n=1 Tax=Argopecten irradians TaxID=31199 RepID=UPI0037190F32
MRPNRSRTRLGGHIEHVMTPTVRKSLLQDFMECDVQEQVDGDELQVNMVTDEFGSFEISHPILKGLDYTPKSSETTSMSDTLGAFDGSCLELLAPIKREDTEERVSALTGPGQTLPRVRRSLSFGGQSEARITPNATRSDDIRNMVEHMSNNDSLIGDGSESHHLPTVAGKHIGMKCISSHTLSEAIRNNKVQIRLIDCRYPYEYDGGHIQGAECRYNQDQILSLLEEGSRSEVTGNKPPKLVFYCEFSSIRAPSMYRFMREKDRAHNRDKYPALIYPEIYLLDGGYQAFFQSFKDLCTPSAYVPMRSQSHLEELRHFRAKSKSWTAGEKRRLYLKCLRL